MSNNNTPSQEQRNAPNKNVVSAPAPSAAESVSTQSADASADRYAITNRGDSILCVPIVGPEGDVQEVFLQPGGKPKLPVGYSVDSTFLRRNPNMSAIKL